MRRSPFSSYLVNGFSVYGLIALGVPSDYYQWTNFIALVVMATRTAYWRSLIGLVLGFGGIAFYFLRFPDEGDPPTMFFVMALYLAGWLIGRAQLTRVREEELRSERDLSEARLAVRAAEAELADERNRIAQELHDIVGHAVNLMVVQAGAGDRVFTSDPEAARKSLQAIANTGRAALLDLDRMLGILSESESRNSLPTLEGIAAMCEEFREAGLAISADVEGDLELVPASISLAGYRLVQEALTNVLKHSGATDVQVRVAVNDELSIVVADNGRGGEPNPAPGSARNDAAGRAPWRSSQLLFASLGWLSGRKSDSAPMIRVALIDDDRLIREGLRMIIDNEPDLEVVLQASNGREGVALLQQPGDRRGPDGCAHAGHGWHRGHRPDHGSGGVAQSRDPHHFRARPIRLRRPPSGCQRLSAQTHSSGAASGSDPGGCCR